MVETVDWAIDSPLLTWYFSAMPKSPFKIPIHQKAYAKEIAGLERLSNRLYE